MVTLLLLLSAGCSGGPSWAEDPATTTILYRPARQMPRVIVFTAVPGYTYAGGESPDKVVTRAIPPEEMEDLLLVLEANGLDDIPPSRVANPPSITIESAGISTTWRKDDPGHRRQFLKAEVALFNRARLSAIEAGSEPRRFQGLDR